MINITPEKMTEPASDDGEVVLSVEGVSKKFCRDLKRSLLYGMQDIASDLTGIRKKSDRLRKNEFWALDNVSFQLKKGEALGLIGKNGSGKSTLLRIIAGLIKPDLGTVKVTGRVAPLIALGAGFNPILTGRENIYANMSILGLSTKEIDERLDDVLEFAEIGDAVNAPVQTYSSGMAARLGFACAIHTEPDILLIDEVLAVGDIRFRQKCFQKLGKMRKNGTSFVLVSHNSQSFFTVCKSAIHISQGKILGKGSVETIIRQYEEELFNTNASPKKANSSKAYYQKDSNLKSSSNLEILELYFENNHGKVIDSLLTGEDTYLKIRCNCHEKVEKATVYLLIGQISGENEVTLSIDSIAQNKSIDLPPGDNEIYVKFCNLGLRPGRYVMKAMMKEDSISVLDFVEQFYFDVKSEIVMNRSLYYQPIEWSF